jgi:hypothetical protein
VPTGLRCQVEDPLELANVYLGSDYEWLCNRSRQGSLVSYSLPPSSSLEVGGFFPRTMGRDMFVENWPSLFSTKTNSGWDDDHLAGVGFFQSHPYLVGGPSELPALVAEAPGWSQEALLFSILFLLSHSTSLLAFV